MIQVITTKQLAEELNRKIKDSRYYANNEVFFDNALVDLATTIDEKTIRLDFHWSEQHRPAFIEYATEEWVQLTDEIEGFKLLKELNEKMGIRDLLLENGTENAIQQLQPLSFEILQVQEELIRQGYETTLHDHYTQSDMRQNKSKGRLYYTIQREKEE